MTTDSDYQRLSIDPVGDYMKGRDANVERARILDANQQAAYLHERARSVNADADNAAANIAPPNPAAAFDPNAPPPSPAPATPGTGLSGAPPVSAPAASPPAPPAAPSRPVSKAKQAAIIADMQKTGLTHASVNGQPFSVPGASPDPDASAGTGMDTPEPAAPAGNPSAPGTGLSGSAPPDALPGGTPTGQMSTYQKQSASYRQQQALALRGGDYKTANDLESKATTADMNHVIDSSAHIADNKALWERAAKMVTVKDPSITIGKDPSGVDYLSIRQPDGTATFHLLTLEDKRNMIAGQALMEAGYSEAGLGKFHQVNVNLATEVATRNKMSMDVATHNNQAHVAQQNSDARSQMADAKMILAYAQQQNADTKMARAGVEKPPQALMDKNGAAAAALNEELQKDNPNPKRISQLTQALNATSVEIDAWAGKPRLAPVPKENPPPKEADVSEVMEQLGKGTSPEAKEFMALPPTARRAKALESMGRGAGGGLPNSFGPGSAKPAGLAVPPAPAAPAAPAGPSMQERARAALAKTPIGGLNLGVPTTDAEALAAKNSFNPYQQPKLR